MWMSERLSKRATDLMSQVASESANVRGETNEGEASEEVGGQVGEGVSTNVS